MNRRNIYLGENPVNINEAPVEGAFVELDGERFYKISNVDRMPDFFMSLVSASDQWMFISSNGSLTAGRRNSESALFPYYSEDKIHDYRGKTGSRTLILVKQEKKLKLWEPFDGSPGIYKVKRNLYKNLLSNKLIFEEINEDLELSFRYAWCNSDRFGFVKQSKLMNHGSLQLELELLDGLQNILPSSADPGLQLSSSNLLDAYKRQELIRGTTLGIYRLSSVPTDAAEPSESLRVNTVWCEGLKEDAILLSALQVQAFRAGFPLKTEQDIKATRGAYFVHAPMLLPAGECHHWSLVAEVDQEKCAACLTCYRACPHGAIEPNTTQHRMDILDPACWQCGICAAVCPGRALEHGVLRDADADVQIARHAAPRRRLGGAPYPTRRRAARCRLPAGCRSRWG